MITSKTGRFSLISLGCPKNQVDSEHLMLYLKKDGFVHTSPDEAETIIINTCAFIDDAKKESIDTILEAAQTGKKLIVYGCLAQRYKEQLKHELPEVDYIFGVKSEGDIRNALRQINSPHHHHALPPPLVNVRERLNPSHYAYLKISEGCNRQCSFCVIPSIRGPYKSFEKKDIVKEAYELVSDGVRELILVAQESTLYGSDLTPQTNLSELLDDLCQIDQLTWIRVLYGHPLSVTDRLLETMALQSKVVNYLDIPLQHSESKILKLMNRRGNAEDYLMLIDKLRTFVPDIVLRTTLITGFPGEDDKDFEGLLSFVREAEFDRLGAFIYCREEGTAAAHLPEQVSEGVKQERLEILMDTQEEISFIKNQALILTEQSVMIDEVMPYNDHVLCIGRYYGQTPDVDGITVVKSQECLDRKNQSFQADLHRLSEGDSVKALIIDASEHDLEGIVR